MALSSADRSFRDLEINLPAEPLYKPEELYDSNNSFDASSVRSFLQNGNHQDALQNGLQQARDNGFPLDENSRTESVKSIVDAMTNFKSNDINNFVESKTVPELDLLMLMVYRGFDLVKGSIESGQTRNLYKWHDAIEKKAGRGSILRVLNDKREL